DEGLLVIDEPFIILLTQGLVLKDGSKLSKSNGNTVDPQALIDEYGADTVRLFIMFAAPPEQSLEWSDSGVEGAFRFLRRLWKQVHLHVTHSQAIPALDKQSLDSDQKSIRRQVHQTLDKVTDDLGRRYTFNTAIAANMELLNSVSKFSDTSDNALAIRQEALEFIVLMLAPIVPHICQHLWQGLGHPGSVITEKWPVSDPSALQQDELEIVVQVNGKLRSKILVSASASREIIEAAALNDEHTLRFIDNKPVKKIIVVPHKLVNIVV
ncbi:MAG: class I tRNA ligase family protein, partial [Methylicorpusculum sp.]|nr:class I tRNA ligase family protein [Methylicorpusculum sp.]